MQIWVMDHREADHQPFGPTIQTWQIHDEEQPGPRYADYCALYGVWGAFTDEPPAFVGFFGYRKYLIWHNSPGIYDRAHNHNWWQCNEEDFNRLRRDYAKYGTSPFLRDLSTHDVLVAEPFYLGTSLIEDFAKSRSPHDAGVLARAMPGWDSQKIYPYLFITRWEVFSRAMRELEPLRKQLDTARTGYDSDNYEYKKRPMAYVMERTWSLWLEHSKLSIKHMPLLHCWEKK